MLTPDEMAQYEEEGFVTIDTPLTDAQLDSAGRAFDALCAPSDTPRHPCFNSSLAVPCASNKDFVEMISNPFFEKVAQQVLRSESVDYIEVFPIDRRPTPVPDSGEYPHWRDEWERGAHVDVQLTRSDFEATPRRDQLTLWLWLSEVTPESGAMRILPGSHKKFMDHWELTLLPERRQYLPRVHGLRPAPAPLAEGLPELGATRWLDQQPIPAVAHRGQLLVVSGTILHSAWHNPAPESRKGFLLQFMAQEVAGGLAEGRIEVCQQVYPGLRSALPLERQHLIPSEFRHFVTGYDEKWPEMFVGGSKM
jgi:hypothetical protein